MQAAVTTSSCTAVAQEAGIAQQPQQQGQVDKQKDDNLSDVKKLMTKIKDAGTAGIISFGLVQLGFWSISIILALYGYVKVTSHFPDMTDKEEMSKVATEAFACVNIARLAAPLRIALALSSTSWIQENILDPISWIRGKKRKQ